jgi:hypothetical protein
MTGIFQIFDRYKSKSYGKNDRRKCNSGGFSIHALLSSFVLVSNRGYAAHVEENSFKSASHNYSNSSFAILNCRRVREQSNS